MIEGLQRELKKLLAEGRIEEVMRRLREEILAVDTQLYDDLILIQGRLTELERSEMRGVIAFENKTITFNGVTEAVLWVIGQLKADDLREESREKQAVFQHIPPYHAFAVDRFAQTEKFEMDRYLAEDPDCKVHFYYLYGDVRQEIPSLISRLGHELNGYLFNANSLTSGNGKMPLIASCKPEPRGNKQLFKILLLKSLLEQFVGPVNNMRDLAGKTLLDLMSSPKLASLGPDDAVCILVALDDYNWRKEIVPEVLKELYSSFCNCELPAEAPKFYFFFGVEYQKDNQTIKDEVAAAIRDRTYGESLDELLPVTREHVAEWFTRHRPLVPGGREAHEVAAEHFQQDGQLDMLDVETKLKQLIDHHNRNLIE